MDIRAAVVAEIDRLNKVLSLLDGKSTVERPAKTRGRRKLSAAARLRIGNAQRARWAKFKKSKA